MSDINVRASGAVGNGVTDDSAAIQSALNSAALTGFGVYFPPGSYLINSTVSIGPATQLAIRGNTATIRFSSTSRVAISVASGTQGLTVSGIMFQGDSSDDKNVNIYAAVLLLDNVTDVEISGCTFDHCQPLTANDSYTSRRLHFRRNYCHNCTGGVHPPSDSSIEDNDFVCDSLVATRAQAIYSYGQFTNLAITNNRFRNIAEEDIQIRSSSARFNQRDTFRITNNHFENSNSYSIWAGSDDHPDIGEFVISGNTLKNSNGGIHCQGATTAIVSNNLIETTWEWPGSLAGGNASITVSGGVGQPSHWNDAKGVVVVGNKLINRHAFVSQIFIDSLPSSGDTLTVGDFVYTWRTTPSVEGDVAIGADVQHSADNLVTALRGGSGPATGVGDTLAVAAGVVTLTDAGASFTSAQVGRAITITGASNSQNNGAFSVSAFISSTSVKYVNASGVNETSSFNWSISDIYRAPTNAIRSVGDTFNNFNGASYGETNNNVVVVTGPRSFALSKTGSPVVSGSSTSVGPNSLTDTTQSMAVNAYALRHLIDHAGSIWSIVSNTATSFTLGANGATPTAGAYTVSAVTITPVLDYRAAGGIPVQVVGCIAPLIEANQIDSFQNGIQVTQNFQPTVRNNVLSDATGVPRCVIAHGNVLSTYSGNRVVAMNLLNQGVRFSDMIIDDAFPVIEDPYVTDQQLYTVDLQGRSGVAAIGDGRAWTYFYYGVEIAGVVDASTRPWRWDDGDQVFLDDTAGHTETYTFQRLFPAANQFNSADNLISLINGGGKWAASYAAFENDLGGSNPKLTIRITHAAGGVVGNSHNVYLTRYQKPGVSTGTSYQRTPQPLLTGVILRNLRTSVEYSQLQGGAAAATRTFVMSPLANPSRGVMVQGLDQPSQSRAPVVYQADIVPGVGFTISHSVGVGPASGIGDSFAVAAGVVTLTDAGATFSSTQVGRNITISGASNSTNNGTFVITAFVSTTSIKYVNASGVSETSSFLWSIDGDKFYFRVN